MQTEKELFHLRTHFIEVYQDTIKRDGADSFLDWLSTETDFFTAPASTRFHGAYEGGLLRHSMNVYACLNDELAMEGLLDTYTPETVSIVSMLHDVCKTNFYKKGFRNVKVDGVWKQKEVYEIDEAFPVGHGEKSVILIQRYFPLNDEEIWAIRCHMGGWDTSVKGGDRFIGKVFERSKLALLLHIADIKLYRNCARG